MMTGLPNCRPDYILDSIDIWCRFWKLCCFVIRTWPWGEGISNTAPEGQDNSSSVLADKMAWNFPPNVLKHLCITVLRLPKLNVFWLKHLLEDWFVSGRTPPNLLTVWKVKLHSSAPWIHFICCPKLWKHISKA